MLNRLYEQFGRVLLGRDTLPRGRADGAWSLSAVDGSFEFDGIRRGASDKWVVWRFIDGKPGHENQTAGLLDALSRIHELEVIDVKPLKRWDALVALLSGVFIAGRELPGPQFIVGAGHATHLSMLAARRAFGGRAIVLMKPTLPMSWFDLCIVPEHDGPEQRDNTVRTHGVLNRIRRTEYKQASRGLILLGGRSRHFGWNDESVITQVMAIVTRSSSIQWSITDSRRTPSSLTEVLTSRLPGNAQFISHQHTPQGWVAAELGTASVVWVSEDSVSMIYEGLTSGAKVGLIKLEQTGESRVARGVHSLAARGVVTEYRTWVATRELLDNPGDVNEAERCARYIAALQAAYA